MRAPLPTLTKALGGGVVYFADETRIIRWRLGLGMAKKVRATGWASTRMNETMLQVLLEIEHQSVGAAGHASRPVALSLAGLAEATDKSEGTVRRSIRSMAEQGIVSVAEAHLPNGGQLENLYCVTPRGEEYLSALRSQGIIEG